MNLREVVRTLRFERRRVLAMSRFASGRRPRARRGTTARGCANT